MAVDLDHEYRSRYTEYREVEERKNALFEEILDKLSKVTKELVVTTAETAQEVKRITLDLDSEKASRLRYQEKNVHMSKQLEDIEQAKFVLVLVDADADNYFFHERFTSRGLIGGQHAAASFEAKIREYLIAVKDSTKPEEIPIVVKAFGSLKGMALAATKNKKAGSIGDLKQFWIGFVRHNSLFDFVDVGSGKEEADKRFRDVLEFNIGNVLCQHVLLACCHDAGYAPYLRPYAKHPLHKERISLLLAGNIRPELSGLGLRCATGFESLFAPDIGSNNLKSGVGYRTMEQSSADAKHTGDSSTSTLAPRDNVDRAIYADQLGPVEYDEHRRRVDKKIDADEEIRERLRKSKLCNWHYLRSVCENKDCKRNHLFRTLDQQEFEALWSLSRQGDCYQLKKHGRCEDERCIYGHPEL